MHDDELILIVAPNGARKTKDDHPRLPITPDEVALAARHAVAVGATMIHAHARDKDGKHTLDPGINQQYYDAIRKAVGKEIVIQLTTEAVGMYQPEEQMALIRAVRPEAASFAIKELVPDASQESVAAEFFRDVCQQGLIPQYIVYSGEELERYYQLLEKGVIPSTPHHILCVMGRYSGNLQSRPGDLVEFIIALKERTRWAVCAFGKDEHQCISGAFGRQGDVRVGFENNLHDWDGKIARDNSVLLRQVVESSGRKLMSAAVFREVFGAS